MATTVSQRVLRGHPLPLAGHAAAFAGYFLAVQLGVLFVLPEAGVSLVWPAAGVALAAVWWLGYGAAVTVGAAAVAAHLWVGQEVAACFGIGVGVAVAAALGVAALRAAGFDGALQSLADVLRLLGIGVVGASAVSSLTGAGVMWVTGTAEWAGFGSLWWICWVADMLGVLLVAPVAMRVDVRAVSSAVAGELTILAVVTGVATWVVYSDVLPAGLAMARPLSYTVFPVMILVAVRTGPRQSALLLLLHAALALALTAKGHGPFAEDSLAESILALHAHLAMVSATTLMLASILAERRAATGALADREAKYRLVVENQSDLILRLDGEGRIRFASPSVGAFFGVDPEALQGALLERLLPELATGADWQRLLRQGGYLERESEVRVPAGRRCLAWVVRGLEGSAGVVLTGRDITERRQAESDSREYLNELAHVGRVSAMGEMAAGLAHELNQPLCAISTYAQACRRLAAGESDELRAAIERVDSNAQRAGDIIRRMRGFVRKDAERSERVEVNNAVTEALQLIAVETRQAGVQVRTTLSADVPAVCASPILLHQVLVNLARNAVEAMAESDTRMLTVGSASVADGRVEITVSDTGPGIPEELLDSLFHPFVTGRDEGMGLGLSISRSIAENLGGSLEAENGPEGAVFRLRLPVADDEEAEA